MKNVALIPQSSDLYNNIIFDEGNNLDNNINPYYALKSHLFKNNFNINTIDKYRNLSDIDIVIFEHIDYIFLEKFVYRHETALRILIPWEPDVVIAGHEEYKLRKVATFFDYILTWNDLLIDNIKFFKLNYPQNLRLKNLAGDFSDFHNRKLLVQISSNKSSSNPKELYSLRKKFNQIAGDYLSNNYFFYGYGWSNNNPNYLGEINDKFNALKGYRFSLCFENMKNTDGYITEKIFDCFSAGVVPIYFGANNISNYIPEDTFIDLRQFDGAEELFQYLISMDYEIWRQYLDSSISYLTSNAAYVFSIENYVETIFKIIQQKQQRIKITFGIHTNIIYNKSRQLLIMKLRKSKILVWISRSIKKTLI